MTIKIHGVLVIAGMIVSTWACQSASGLLDQVGYQLEEELGEGGGWDSSFPEDGPVELSSFCKSMLPTGIFMQEPDAKGAIYPDEVRGFGVSGDSSIMRSL